MNFWSAINHYVQRALSRNSELNKAINYKLASKPRECANYLFLENLEFDDKLLISCHETQSTRMENIAPIQMSKFELIIYKPR